MTPVDVYIYRADDTVLHQTFTDPKRADDYIKLNNHEGGVVQLVITDPSSITVSKILELLYET